MIDKKENIFESKEESPAKTTRTQLGNDVLVVVKSCFHGRLIYENQKTGETTIWEEAGETQLLTMGDLRAMKAQQVAFFKNQWIMIVGIDEAESVDAAPSEIYKALAITQYYKNFIDPSDLSVVCNWTTKEIEERVALMSSGVRENLIVALNGLIKNGALDSVSKIKAFEKALECELMNHN